MQLPRVAIIGVILESNRQAVPAGEEDFRSLYWLEGQEIIDQARSGDTALATEACAFVKAMDATGQWEPVPILLAGSHPAGPVEGALIDQFIDRITTGLRDAGKLDAVYVANHGGMTATDREDPDGDIISGARSVVGAGTPIVVTLDLHANISDRMVDDSNLIVGYRTNPHVDMIERGEEAALALRMMLAGTWQTKSAFIRLPLAPASVSLLTEAGPYADLIDYGQRRQAEHAGGIVNVSIFGGFVFSDTSKNGLAIIVTARNDLALAEALAEEIAMKAWDMRTRFKKELMPVSEAVSLALETDRTPVIFSDSGDNPGGGGTGRTTELLTALVKAKAENVLIGCFFDPPLAVRAHEAGPGGEFRAEFNSHPGVSCDKPFEADVVVAGLREGDITGRLGLYAGRILHLGKCAALRIGGITAVVISNRYQTADPILFEMFDLDIGAAHTLAVKSRGHFRAGFRPWFEPGQVFEIDTEGLTSPVLERIQWHGLPRPVYPLDEETVWERPEV
jgi:microcystin degradation protein MlrC